MSLPSRGGRHPTRRPDVTYSEIHIIKDTGLFVARK
jgi:hypothetical protein